MGTTPTYSFPYPELTDDDNVPADLKALALAVEDELAGGSGARTSLAPYLTGATVSSGAAFDIRTIGKFREIRGSINRSLPTGTTDIATAITSADDWPGQTVFANCYLAGGNIGVAFIRANGTIAINNMSGGTRNGDHQFSLFYTVD